MKKIKIGQIGTKHDHARDHWSCAKKYPDIFELVGVVEPDEQQRRRVMQDPAYDGCRFLTEEQLFDTGCQAIMVEGYELELPFVAKRCVDNGIAVHMDKPAGNDLQVFEDTLRIAKHKGLPVQMGYMYRQNPAVRDCLALIRDGRLGEIHSIYAIMNTCHSLEKRKWLENFNGGNLFFLGCHMIDLIFQIQGVPKSVTPFLKSSGYDGTTAIDTASVIFEYEHGFSIAQSNSCEVNGFGRRQLVVCGTEGTYELNPIERPINARFTERFYADPYNDSHTDRNIMTEPLSCRMDRMMLDFAAILHGEMENPYSYEYELQLQKLILACCGHSVDYKTQVIL